MSLTRTLQCRRCGCDFVQTLVRDNGCPLPKFCSTQCRTKARIKKLCQRCNREYEVIEYRSNKTRFCSAECMYAIEGLATHVYATKEWEEARKKALARDNYTCQKCGKRKEEISLHVNHIVPYRLIRSHLLPNLVTLCISCHARMDWMVRDLISMDPVRGEFLELLVRMWETNLRKSNDYAGDDDPLSNFKRSTKIGVTPFQGILVRIGDKMSRIEQLSIKEGLVKDESIKDTLLDLAVYSILAYIVYEEKNNLDKSASPIVFS